MGRLTSCNQLSHAGSSQPHHLIYSVYSCLARGGGSAPALRRSAQLGATTTSNRFRSSKRGIFHVKVSKDPLNTEETGQESVEQESLKRLAEDELKDPANFVEYLLPRPLRLTFLGGGVVSCFVASVVSASQVSQQIWLHLEPDFSTLLINLGGLAAFALVFVADQQAASKRMDRRKQIREAQIRLGDREIFLNEKGERMSRLKEVNDEWILRRLERWGKRDNMPFIGPKKGHVLQSLVRQRQPDLAVEVGSMAGYSALTIAGALKPGARLISIEADPLWALTAKRFVWQAAQGEARSQSSVRRTAHVDIWWGKAERLLSAKFERGESIDFLFLDGLPKEYLLYLQAAEPFLAPGALVVADNAGIFSQGGLKPYLEYVRSSPLYDSSFVEVPLEWRDDVQDGFEISQYNGPTGSSIAGPDRT